MEDNDRITTYNIGIHELRITYNKKIYHKVNTAFAERRVANRTCLF